MKSDFPVDLPDIPRSNSHQNGPYQSAVLQAIGERDDSPSHDVLVEQVNDEQVSRLLPGSSTYHRRSPSPALWHFILLAGDTLLIVSLLLFTSLRGMPALEIPGYSMLNGGYIWGGLAFISWSVATALMQPESLLFAANRFKSSLAILFTLVLMFALWIGLTWLFIGNDLAAFTKVDVFFLGIAIPTLSIWRIALAECMRLPTFRQRAVIVGVNSAGATLVKELQLTRHPNLSILGYIGEEREGGLYIEQGELLPVLGSRSMLRYMVQRGMIDLIVMALDYKVNSPLFQETIEAALSGVAVVPMPVVYERVSGKIAVEHIGDQWFGALPAEPVVSFRYACWRRSLDIAFGIFGTTVMLALLPVMALCIYIDAPGPIFYKQERVGYRGNTFHILKFRSMRSDAEKMGNAVWAAERDSRVTRVGRLLRAIHLDELPQVINILRGEMSLIGPRPERQVFVDRLATVIPFYHCRLSVLPGLTGWAQVKYPYASSDHDALMKLQYDLYYIKHRSFMLDIFILLKTVVEVLFCRGR